MNRKILRAYGLYTGGVIGVGIFGLPAALHASGIVIFVVSLLSVAALVWFIHRSLLEVVIATNGKHRLPGYARLYLGSGGFKIAAAANMLGLFGALIAYLIAGGTFLRLLFEGFLDLSPAAATIGYALPGALLLLWGLRALPTLEVVILGAFLLVLTLLSVAAIPHFDVQRVLSSGDPVDALLPYGVLLFSFWGLSMVPETFELVGRKKKRGIQALAAGFVTAVVCYAVFALVVKGITGDATTADALTGLRTQLGDGVVLLTLLFGILTTFSSYLALGLTLLRTLTVDFRRPRMFAWALTVVLPLALVMLGVDNLLHVLSVTGAVFLGLEGLVVLAMRAVLVGRRRAPRFHIALLVVGAFLTLGVISEVVRSVIR